MRENRSIYMYIQKSVLQYYIWKIKTENDESKRGRENE